jgi:hypothetical protein
LRDERIENLYDQEQKEWPLESGRGIAKPTIKSVIESFAIYFYMMGAPSVAIQGAPDYLMEEGGEAMVLVALGNEGVLRGPAGGEAWERLGVGWAEATPERAGNLQALWPPSTVLTETLALLAAAAIAFLVFSSRSWALSPRKPGASGGGHRGFWWAAGILFALVVVAAILLGAAELLLPVGIPVALGLAYLAFLGQRWSITVEDSLQPRAAQQCLWISLLAAFGFAAVAWLFFALWVFGVVPIYSLALVLAGSVLIAGWVWGWRQIGQTFGSGPSAS